MMFAANLAPGIYVILVLLIKERRIMVWSFRDPEVRIKEPLRNISLAMVHD